MNKPLFFSIMDSLYETDESDRNLDPDYNAPDKFPYGDWVKIAEFKGEGDGQDCKVYECRMPARFYKVEAFDTPNSVGKINKGFALSTGSGTEMGKLIFAIARAISEGMIGLASNNESEDS